MRQAKHADFSGQNIYAGLDVHRKSWKVSIYTEAFEHKTFTQPPNPRKLVSYLQRVFPNGHYHAVYEAGFSGFWTYDALTKMGVNCTVVHPGDVPTTDKDRRRKTDARDSRKLAKQLRSGVLEPIHIPSILERDNRGLLRQRKTVSRDAARAKVRIKHFLHFHGIEIPLRYCNTYWSANFLEWIRQCKLDNDTGRSTLLSLLRQYEYHRKEIAQIYREIRNLSRSPVYADNVNYLMTLPGIGRLSAMIWLTELGNIHRFKSFDKLCSYVGLVPLQHSSGETDHTGGLEHRGNKILRTLLIENAWVAVRSDPDLLTVYHQLIKRMKGQMAIIRIARKLLARIRYVLLNQCELQK
ncbi:MAG: IS110 family transposase [Candidatus Marinimicrobia bacterium]|nr:IS110 family transposase [Candidatus Neomarinimicrobiota bacterium]